MGKRKIRRIYSTSDMNLTLFAYLLLEILTEKLSDFTNFRSSFNAQFVADFKQEIDVAFHTISDKQKRKEIAVVTGSVLNVMEDCRKQYKVVMNSASEVFEGMPGILDEFGKSTYSSVRYQHEKMFYFMENLYKVSKKYETELLGTGLSQAKIDHSQTLANALQEAVGNQNTGFGSRTSTTTHRIIRMNTLYKTVMSIRKAGALIYDKDYAMIKKLSLPWGKKGWKGGVGDGGE